MRQLDGVRDLVRALNGRDPREDERSYGSRSIGPNDTIGSDLCWCGEPGGHDWPGRGAGEPHPDTDERRQR